MTKIKKNETETKPVNKAKFVKVEAFGNRCNICGTFFEDEICSNGHVIGQVISN